LAVATWARAGEPSCEPGETLVQEPARGREADAHVPLGAGAEETRIAGDHRDSMVGAQLLDQRVDSGSLKSSLADA
jgi:hypothetical protein